MHLHHPLDPLGNVRAPDLVRTVSALGLNKAPVWAQLRHGTGPNPLRHRWFKTPDGRYRLHP